MLSGIASYFFGASEDAEEKKELEPRLQTRFAENCDWVIVDQSSSKSLNRRSDFSLFFFVHRTQTTELTSHCKSPHSNLQHFRTAIEVRQSGASGGLAMQSEQTH